jgi:class 3 adenylate cyclase
LLSWDRPVAPCGETDHPVPTRNLTILLTDIKGYTARVSQAARVGLSELNALHERLLPPVFAHFGGTIVKRVGDAYLVRFDSPTDAVLCGVTLQEVLRQHNHRATEVERLEIRVAINAGEVELLDDDVLGEPVNIAARLEEIAEAGEVFFTEAVYLTMNRREAPCTEIGERTFRGVPYPVRVYQVIQSPDSELGRRLASSVRVTDRGPVVDGVGPGRPRVRGGLLAAAIALIVLAVAAQGWVLVGLFREDDAAADARAAWERGDIGAALDIVDGALRAEPGDAALRACGVEVAGAYADLLAARSGAAEALRWVRLQLDNRSFLEPLRARIPELDARATVDEILGSAERRDDPRTDVDALIARHPNDAGVPYLAATLLAGEVYPHTPIRLFRLALSRGHPADEAIFDYCIGLFARIAPGGHVDPAHALLEKYFRERTIAWARRAVAETESGVVFLHAWNVLQAASDPLCDDPVNGALRAMVQGFPGEDAADASLRALEHETDPARRARIVALHRWVVDPDKGVSWGGRNFALVRRNLDALTRD